MVAVNKRYEDKTPCWKDKNLAWFWLYHFSEVSGNWCLCTSTGSTYVLLRISAGAGGARGFRPERCARAMSSPAPFLEPHDLTDRERMRLTAMIRDRLMATKRLRALPGEPRNANFVFPSDLPAAGFRPAARTGFLLGSR